MAVEIERKFLILNPEVLQLGEGVEVDQGYLSETAPTIRVRTMGPKAFLTIKHKPSPTEAGGAVMSHEYEYPIPHSDALELLALCSARISKTRHYTPSGLEIDVFRGRHSGLVMAEYESEDGSMPEVPAGVNWLEVSEDRRYSNHWMARNGVPPGS